MKRFFYLMLLPLLWSCSRGSEPQYIYGPDPSYFQIQENEVKVEDFQIYFKGEMTLEFTVYEAEYDQEEKKGKLIKRGSLEVDGEKMLEVKGGFKFIDITIIPGDGAFDILLNNEELLVGNMGIWNFDSEFSFFIPYKYRIN